MDGGAWWAAVHGVATSQMWLSDFTFTFRFHALEKAMATHSSVLAWRIPGTEEPGGLPSMGLHRVGHDWSDLAAAATAFPLAMCEGSSFFTFWPTLGTVSDINFRHSHVSMVISQCDFSLIFLMCGRNSVWFYFSVWPAHGLNSIYWIKSLQIETHIKLVMYRSIDEPNLLFPLWAVV